MYSRPAKGLRSRQRPKEQGPRPRSNDSALNSRFGGAPGSRPDSSRAFASHDYGGLEEWLANPRLAKRGPASERQANQVPEPRIAHHTWGTGKWPPEPRRVQHTVCHRRGMQWYWP